MFYSFCLHFCETSKVYHCIFGFFQIVFNLYTLYNVLILFGTFHPLFFIAVIIIYKDVHPIAFICLRLLL